MHFLIVLDPITRHSRGKLQKYPNLLVSYAISVELSTSRQWYAIVIVELKKNVSKI